MTEYEFVRGDPNYLKIYMSKRLQKSSQYEKYDIDGDGVV